jgi:hypothetical protein
MPEQAEAGVWLRLDSSDGFRPDLNSGSFFADSDGSFWVGAANDIVHYSPPADLVAPQAAPQLFISAFSWDGAVPKLAEAWDGVPHGSKAVAHVGSLQFDRRSALKLRYRILPEQHDWRESKDLTMVRHGPPSFHGAHTGMADLAMALGIRHGLFNAHRGWVSDAAQAASGGSRDAAGTRRCPGSGIVS